MLAQMRFVGAVLATAFAASAAQAAPVNLVNNGDFETGDFTGWTQFGDTTFNGVGCSPGFGYSGNCAAFFGPIGTTGGISQTLTGLTSGGRYIISFGLETSGDIPSSVLVTFGGTTLLNLVNPPAPSPFGFQAYNFNVNATGASQALVFTFRDDAGFHILDTVAVTVPEPATLALAGAALVGLALSRRRSAAVAAAV